MEIILFFETLAESMFQQTVLIKVKQLALQEQFSNQEVNTKEVEYIPSGLVPLSC
jgi:hypothetical protein